MEMPKRKQNCFTRYDYSTPTVSTVVQQMKGYVTKCIGFSSWQRSFHDHIVRNGQDCREIWNYIDTNPVKWEEDMLFRKGDTA